METYLENLKEKKGLSGKYQTSSKLFQNCSELFKTQVIFDSSWREIEEVNNMMAVFLVICISHSSIPSDRSKLESCSEQVIIHDYVHVYGT